MRRLSLLLLAALCGGAIHLHGGGGGGGGGGALTPGSGFTAAIPLPAQVGSNTAETLGVWDSVPRATYSTTFSVCLIAFHPPTTVGMTATISNGSGGAGNILNVSAILDSSGPLAVGMTVYADAKNVTAGTTITGLGTGTGGTGTYTVSSSLNIASETMHAYAADDGITKVSFSADNGPFVDVVSLTANPKNSANEYCISIDPTAAGWADGPHEICAVAYPVAGYPKVFCDKQVASTISIANPAVVTHLAQPYQPGAAVTISTTGTLPSHIPAGNYFLTKAADTVTGRSYQLSLTSGGAAISTVGDSPPTGTITVKPTLSSTLFNMGDGLITGESMWINTNGHGNNFFRRIVVDNNSTACSGATCSDSANCGTVGTPCLTIYGALALYSPINSAISSFTAVNGSDLVATRTNHGLGNGQVVYLGGTWPGVIGGMPSIVYATAVTTNTFKLAATPGGTPLLSDGTAGSGANVTGDTGGLEVCLNNGSGAGYINGAASTGFNRIAAYQYAGVTRCAGQTTAVINGNGTSGTGLRIMRVRYHDITVDATAGFACGNKGGNLAQCNGALDGQGAAWLDNVTFLGPGFSNSNTYVSAPMANTTNGSAWPFGIYFTNSTATNYAAALVDAQLVSGSTVSHIGGSMFNNTLGLIASSGSYNGENSWMASDSVGTTASGATTITILPASSPLSDYSTIGYGFYIRSSLTSCLPGQGTAGGLGNVLSADFSAPPNITVTLGSATTCSIPAGTDIIIGTPQHPDFFFNYFLSGPAIDNVTYGLTGTNNIQAMGVFTQNGGMHGFAVVNANVSVFNQCFNAANCEGYYALKLEDGNENFYVKDSTLGNSNYGGPVFSRIVFQNTTCGALSAVSAAITFVGSATCGP